LSGRKQQFMWRRYLTVALLEMVWCSCQIFHQGDMQPDCIRELMVRPHLDNSHWVANHWSFGAGEFSLTEFQVVFRWWRWALWDVLPSRIFGYVCFGYFVLYLRLFWFGYFVWFG